MSQNDNLNANDLIDNGSANELTPAENCIETTITNLTEGILNIYQPHLKKIQMQLHELTIKQKVVIEQLHNENLKLAWSQNSPEYQDLFKKIQVYRDKLLTIKKDMRLLHEKSAKLKKRAIRVQLIKEKEDLLKKQQRQREEDLIKK